MGFGALEQAELLLRNGQAPDAIAIVLGALADPESQAAAAADGLAQQLDQRGDSQGAIDVLRKAIENIGFHFYLLYTLGRITTRMGAPDKAAVYFRLAHCCIGWTESLERGYTLSHDFFSPNIPTWNRMFGEHIHQAPIRYLEIGSWQGGSASWLLDKVIGPRGGNMVCIDTFAGSSEHGGLTEHIDIEKIFDSNLARTGRSDLVTKIVGRSRDVLPMLSQDQFDLVYIDGAHEAKFVLQDAILSLPLVKRGGFLLFDDLDFTFPDHPEQDTILAINFFLSVFRDDISVVEKTHQLLVRRN